MTQEYDQKKEKTMKKIFCKLHWKRQNITWKCTKMNLFQDAQGLNCYSQIDFVFL